MKLTIKIYFWLIVYYIKDKYFYNYKRIRSNEYFKEIKI